MCTGTRSRWHLPTPRNHPRTRKLREHLAWYHGAVPVQRRPVV